MGWCCKCFWEALYITPQLLPGACGPLWAAVSQGQFWGAGISYHTACTDGLQAGVQWLRKPSLHTCPVLGMLRWSSHIRNYSACVLQVFSNSRETFIQSQGFGMLTKSPENTGLRAQQQEVFKCVLSETQLINGADIHYFTQSLGTGGLEDTSHTAQWFVLWGFVCLALNQVSLRNPP